MFRGLFGSISAERFIKAARSNDLATVQSYIAENSGNPDAINRADPNNGMFFALMAAANEGHVEIVKALLAVPGIDPNVTDMARDTPLIVAARRGHTAVVKALLSAPRLKLSLTNNQNLGAAQEAGVYGQIEIAHLITAEAAARAFRRAAHNGNVQTVQRYIALNRNNLANFINATDRHGLSALSLAAGHGNFNVVRALLAVPEIDVNIRDERGLTALSRAAHNGHTDCVTALLDTRRANINDVDAAGNTALIHAAYHGRTEVVRALVAENDIDLTLENHIHLTAGRAAAQRNHVEVVQLIEAANVTPHVRNLRQTSARRAAAQMLEAALAAGSTPAAPRNRSVDNASATNQSAAIITAEQFLTAVREGNLASVQAYIAAHRDDPAAMNVVDHGNWTAMHLAVRRGNTRIITALGAVSTIMVNRFNAGFTPLMYAAGVVRTPEVVTALLALPQIEVNLRNELGNTALHHSTQGYREDVTAVLVRDSRVDLTIENNDHQTAAGIARRIGHIDVAIIIEREIERRAAASPSSNPPAAYNPSSATNSLGPFRTIAETSTISPQRFLAAARDGELLTIQNYISTHRRNLEGAMNVADPASGNTALIMAASAGRENIVSELLNTQGVNIESQNRNGLNAAQVAQQNGHAEIAVRLMQLLSARAAPIPESQPNSTPMEAAAAVPKTPSPPIPLNFEQRLAAINFNEDEIPNEFKCPITRCIMNDPVSVSSGQTYDRPALAACFSNGRVTYPDPLTREIIHIEALKNHTNQIIKSVIEKFVSNQEKAYAKRLQEEAEKKAAAQPPQEQAAPQPLQEPAAPQEPSAITQATPEPAAPSPSPERETTPGPGLGLFDQSQRDQSPEPRTPPSPKHD